jgi:hypothetical protein
MTVPVHNLYDFIHQVTKNKYLLLYFYPWGHKAISNICYHQIDQKFVDSSNGIPEENRYPKHIETNIDSFKQVRLFQPIIICHDQEPLQFDLYAKGSEFVNNFVDKLNQQYYNIVPPDLFELNLRLAIPFSLQKTCILLHSEINSLELQRYEKTGNFQGAYWWSHAVIARDWYRFAEFDRSLRHKDTHKIFLSYCRDTSGLRSYRKDYLNLLDHYQLIDHCQLSCQDITSDASATYSAEDFNHTAISVVLETVFDQRIHLTEKILRPIACGHPFILAAGPGSLKLLKSYGFQTFSEYINESYDDIMDSAERLRAIVKEMQRIVDLPKDQRHQLFNNLRKIAAYNQHRFFSTEFIKQVTDQLEQNVESAFNIHQGELDFKTWWQRRTWRKKIIGADWKKNTDNSSSTKMILSLMRQQRLTQNISREQ